MRYKFFEDQSGTKSIAFGDIEEVLEIYQGRGNTPDNDLTNASTIRCYTTSVSGPAVSLVNDNNTIIVTMPDEYQVFFTSRGITFNRLMKAVNISQGYDTGDYLVSTFGFFDDIPVEYLDFDICVGRYGASTGVPSAFSIYTKTKEDYFQLMISV